MIDSNQMNDAGRKVRERVSFHRDRIVSFLRDIVAIPKLKFTTLSDTLAAAGQTVGPVTRQTCRSCSFGRRPLGSAAHMPMSDRVLVNVVILGCFVLAIFGKMSPG